MPFFKKIHFLLFYMLEQVSKMAISHVPGSTYQILRESFIQYMKKLLEKHDTSFTTRIIY